MITNGQPVVKGYCLTRDEKLRLFEQSNEIEAEPCYLGASEDVVELSAFRN